MGAKHRARRAVILACAALLATGCAPETNLSLCKGVPDVVARALETRLTTPGMLRNAVAVTVDDAVFLSVELVPADEDEDFKGDVLTFVGDAIETSEYFAVDRHARDDTGWPEAKVDVRAKGAVESRGCAFARRGPPDELTNL